jgi:butyrate kinase
VDKEKYKIFAINPGSTSTKIALFEADEEVFSANVSHDAATLKQFREIPEQFPYRKQAILDELAKRNVSLVGAHAFVGRCGGMGPITGGTYEINDLLLKHSVSGRATKHPANLGGQLAYDFAVAYGGKAFIVNPPDTDEFEQIARVTGFSDVARESKTHTLNQKEVAIRHAASIGRRYEDLNLIISHIGGGLSVSVHRRGRIIDSNNIVDGDGPMAPTRAGTLPAVAIVDMCFSGKYTQREMYDRITKNGGLVDHLGTAEVIEILERIKKGDAYAKLIYDAMIYQIGKAIGAYATVLSGQVDAILLTGGVARDSYLVEQLTGRVKYIAPVKVYAGEFEMEALAAGAIRVLTGQEKAKTYTGEPVWSGFGREA